jgi:hypothetical protein
MAEMEHAAIREQLERILSDPLFRNSKRYPNLLRYIVEHTLDGHKAELKERTLGVEVFGRNPGYDTNADPIVRATAGEIRKRIAQYYHEPGRDSELRIDLVPGSYVPEFGPPVPSVAPRLIALAPAAVQAPGRHGWLRYVSAGFAVCAIAAGLLYTKPWVSDSALKRFWAPLVDTPGPVLICVGQRQYRGSSPEFQQKDTSDIPRPQSAQTGPADQTTVSELYYLGSQNVAMPDLISITRLAGLLDLSGKPYQIRGQSSTSLSDLRNSPVILVGAFNNDWTLRLAGPLRFGFSRDGYHFWISDRTKPLDKSRGVTYDMPYLKLTEDFAVITRVHDPTTERMVMIVAGLTGYGTTAAGEFVSNPAYLEALSKTAPRNWASQNMQVVISTKVINGNSGPPNVIEQYFW